MVADVEQRRSGKWQVRKSERKQRDRQPDVEDNGKAPVILTVFGGGENAPRVNDEPPRRHRQNDADQIKNDDGTVSQRSVASFAVTANR